MLFLLDHQQEQELKVRAEMLEDTLPSIYGYGINYYYQDDENINEFHLSYMGCYKPSGQDDDKMEENADVTPVTIVECVNSCRHKKWSLAGL